MNTSDAILLFMFSFGLAEHVGKAPPNFSYPTSLLFSSEDCGRAVRRLILSMVFFGLLPLISYWLALAMLSGKNVEPFEVASFWWWVRGWAIAFLVPGGLYRIYASVLFQDRERLRYTFAREWKEAEGWCWQKLDTYDITAWRHFMGGLLYLAAATAALLVECVAGWLFT